MLYCSASIGGGVRYLCWGCRPCRAGWERVFTVGVCCEGCGFVPGTR